MKKFAFVLSVICLGGLNVHAQGTIQFNNSGTFPILITSGTDAASLAAATPIGTNPTSEALGGGPGQVTIDMYIALASAPTQYFLAGTTTNSASSLSSFQGTFHGGNPYTIPSTLDGGAFIPGATIDYYFTAISSSSGPLGPLGGVSATGTGYVLAGGATSPSVTFGTSTGLIPGFTISPITFTPEPSTLAIGALGLAVAILYRRRR